MDGMVVYAVRNEEKGRNAYGQKGRTLWTLRRHAQNKANKENKWRPGYEVQTYRLSRVIEEDSEEGVDA